MYLNGLGATTILKQLVMLQRLMHTIRLIAAAVRQVGT
jgi:hypothetical protein